MAEMPSDEELMEWMTERMDKIVEERFHEDGQVLPFFTLIGECLPNGEAPPDDATVQAVVPLNFADDEHKQRAFELMKDLSKAMRAHIIGFATEAWMVKSNTAELPVRPSMHPDRVEGIVVTIQTRTDSKIIKWEIQRPMGSKPYLDRREVERDAQTRWDIFDRGLSKNTPVN